MKNGDNFVLKSKRNPSSQKYLAESGKMIKLCMKFQNTLILPDQMKFSQTQSEGPTGFMDEKVMYRDMPELNLQRNRLDGYLMIL